MPLTHGKSQLLAILLVLLASSSTACRLDNFIGRSVGTNSDLTNKLKLQISEDGIYRVTGQELAQAGMIISGFDLDNLRLSHRGEIVPTLIDDDSLVFYGLKPESRYIAENSYFLEYGVPGKEMSKFSHSGIENAKDAAISQTLHFEENLEYVSEARKEDYDDVWFWYKLRQQDAFSLNVELPEIEPGQAKVRFNTWGLTFDRTVEGDHSVDILINDQYIGSVEWDGQTYHTAEMAVPSGILRSGANSITVDNRPEGATFLDIMLINWMELEFNPSVQAIDDQAVLSTDGGTVHLEPNLYDSLILDITNPSAPAVIASGVSENDQLTLNNDRESKFVISSSDGFLSPRLEPFHDSIWSSDEIQADIIIITTDALASPLAPLVKAREAQGLTVALVEVEEIYDVFGYGESSPESIRNFIEFAYKNWQAPKPRYLFIVGDASIDFHGYISDVPENVIPSFIVPVQFSGETVSDSRLADVEGDGRPELAVGRWPVRTVLEVESLVERTLEYEQQPAIERVIFSADGSESQFQAIASQLVKASNLPQDQVNILVGSPANGIAAELNKGSWLATYIGHGSIDQWGKEGILELESVGELDTKSPPIVLQFTCLTGLFSHPDETSLVEAMLAHPSGPVLTVAATSLTLSHHQEIFAVELLKQLQNNENERIGDAFQKAKLALDIENSNGLREISDTFVLFGDPSAIIVRP